VKLAAVAVMTAIGTWARRTGSLADDAATILRRLRIDAAVFLFVLAAAAVLGAQTPPAHMAAEETAAAIPIAGPAGG
jgi:hypothetical protein